jgi:hypothetical protein
VTFFSKSWNNQCSYGNSVLICSIVISTEVLKCVLDIQFSWNILNFIVMYKWYCVYNCIIFRVQTSQCFGRTCCLHLHYCTRRQSSDHSPSFFAVKPSNLTWTYNQLHMITFVSFIMRSSSLWLFVTGSTWTADNFRSGNYLLWRAKRFIAIIGP